MWKRLAIALLCAAVSFGFNSNGTGGAPAAPGAPVVNPPGGQNNYLPINQPTWTGAGAGPTLNLTGAAPALTFNGVPIGGSCAGSDFINAISASGVISCATPAGGGGGLPTPVSVANGGLGQGNAPTAGQILVAQSATLYSNVPMTGDVTINAAGATTVSTIGGVAPGTLFAPLVNPTNGQNNYAPLASPAFTGTTTATAMQVANTLSAPTFSATNVTVNTGGILMMAGSAALYFNGIAPGGTCAAGTVMTALSATIVPTCTALPAGSITDAMLANAYSGVGACTGGQFVTTLNRNAAPTCATPPGAGTFAPLNNPIGGQNNYAPISGPNFTGTVSVGGVPLNSLYAQLANPAGGQNNYAPINNPTFTGTVTLPNAAVTDVMLANAYSGVGACAAGSVATTLNRNAAPTCSTLASLGGGLFAPLTNPAGGQNNYAPLATPTFTGLVTSSGSASFLTLAVGQAVVPVVSSLAAFTFNANNNTSIAVTNGTAGPAAYSTVYLNNDLFHYGSIQLGSSTTGGGQSDLFLVQTNALNGMHVATTNGGSIEFDVVGTRVANVLNSGLQLWQPLLINYPPSQVSVNTVNSTVTIANGGSANLPTCSGLVVVTDVTQSGETCVYATGGGGTAMIGGSRGTLYCSAATAPVAGQFSVAPNGPTYAIFNNMGQAITFGVFNVCTRPAA